MKCEFAGTRAANKTPAVRFLVEKVKDGVKVAIKGRPETEEVIATKALDEPVGKVAFAYTDRWLGPREEIGSKGAGLGNRLRAALKTKWLTRVFGPQRSPGDCRGSAHLSSWETPLTAPS
ncbi:MAG: hypothetical protein ACYS9X_21605 [Planctomycetota bacterium]